MAGLSFVITGVTRVNRDELTNILKCFGAKVTTTVSGKTTYLIIGEMLEDGRQISEGNKYKKASESNTKIIDFEELQELIRTKSGNPNLNLESFDWKNPATANLAENQHYSALQQTTVTGGSLSFLKPAIAESANRSNVTEQQNVQANYLKNNNLMSLANNKNDTNKINNIAALSNSGNELWTTKYIPKSCQEIIGNQSNIKKITEWLQDWHDVNILGNKKEYNVSYNNKFKNENPNSKAMLISGDPGVGKTSSVRLLGKLLGFKLFELNASDQRNKNIILKKVGYLTDSTTLEGKKEEKINQKNLIVMDEIDGMAGNEDRGGVAALIQIIKETKTPIICICNDRQSQKLKSLANYCYDIRFAKPEKRQITKRLMEVCAMEGLKVEENAIENLCESVGNDIRQCLNFLQFWSRKSKELKFFDMKNNYDKFNKDSSVMINHFDGVNKLLTKAAFSKMNFREKLNMFFLDYDLVPMLVQENYLSCFKEKSVAALERIYKSAEHISFSDLLDKKIKSQSEWNLLQDKGIHSSVAVGQYSASFLGFPKFPE